MSGVKGLTLRYNRKTVSLNGKFIYRCVIVYSQNKSVELINLNNGDG